MMKFSKSIEVFRQHVPGAVKQAYFESASTGLIPDFVYDGVRRYMDDRYYTGGDSVWKFPEESIGTLGMMQRSKQALADMMHCSPTEIAFGQSATQMFTMVTEGIDYAEGDNVVTVAEGFIGNRYAWQKKEAEGLEVRYVYPVNGIITPEQILSVCDSHTKAVTVNLVDNKTGYRIDIAVLGKACKDRHILLFADGVQALGVLQVDVKAAGIDFMVGNDYKWMMGFCGTGYAYISPAVQKLLHHWGAGWMSDTERFNTAKERLELRADAGRFEIGYPHADGIYALGLSALQYQLLGGHEIETYVCGLTAYFIEKIRPDGHIRCVYDFPVNNRSQIIYIKVSAECKATDETLKAAGVFAHFEEADEHGERGMRLSFHYYTSKEDIDRLIDALEEEK